MRALEEAEESAAHGLFDEGSHLIEFNGCGERFVVAITVLDLAAADIGAYVEAVCFVFRGGRK